MPHLENAVNLRTWWKDAVVYQIWPAGFKDSDGDGFGDLGGVMDSLDYIKSIGVDAIWLSPIFESPQIDLGYDISNYEEVYRPYGSVADVQRLITACHDRGLKILLDLVVNHTSDQHAWFKESRRSRDSPKRNWYIWQPPKYDAVGNRRPPNNWRANFSGSAWSWDEESQEYYLHLFAKEQPDVNWACPELREAIYQSALVFWLEKGIDGFRIDTMTILSKDPAFPDAEISNPSSPWQSGRQHYNSRPETFKILREMNNIMARYGDMMTVGELGPLKDTDVALKYVSGSEKHVGMGFQFENVCLGYALNHWDLVPHTLPEFKRPWAKWQSCIQGTDGWTCAFLENHDVPRSVSRFGSDAPEHRETSAKMLAMMLATSTGTLFIYQGQELGMSNIPKTWPIEEYQDISASNHFNMLRASGASEKDLEDAMGTIRKIARDHARTPMQWDASPHAGFTSALTGPWMRVNDNYLDINVKRQQTDPRSVLSFWKQLLALRKEYIDLFAHGEFHILEVDSPDIFMYIKQFGSQKAFVVLNFTPGDVGFTLPSVVARSKLILTTSPAGAATKTDVLSAFEGRIYCTDS